MQHNIKISLIGHLILIVITSLTMQFLIKKVELPPSISVDLVDIGKKTNIPYAPKYNDTKSDKIEKDRVVANQAPPKIVPK